MAKLTIVCTIISILKKIWNNLFIVSVKKKIMNKYIFRNNWSRNFDITYHEKYPITISLFYCEKSWISNHEIIDFLFRSIIKLSYIKLDSYDKKWEISTLRFILSRIHFFNFKIYFVLYVFLHNLVWIRITWKILWIVSSLIFLNLNFLFIIKWILYD